MDSSEVSKRIASRQRRLAAFPVKVLRPVTSLVNYCARITSVLTLFRISAIGRAARGEALEQEPVKAGVVGWRVAVRT